jgi:hypothetical protein
VASSHSRVTVVLYPNPAGLRPAEAARLRRQFAERGVSPAIVRIAPHHIEVEVPSHSASRALLRLKDILGEPLALGGPCERLQGWLECFLELARQQRFWEAHTAAEAGWRLAGRSWAQALAAAAGALAKAQEGTLEAAIRLAWRAARLGGGVLNGVCLESLVRRAYAGERVLLEECIRLEAVEEPSTPRSAWRDG